MHNDQLPYYDQLHIELHIIENGWSDDPPLSWASTEFSAGYVDITKLSKDLERIATAPFTGDVGVETFRSKITANHFSWGADSSVLTAIIEIGGLAAAGDYLSRALIHLASMYRSQQNDGYRHDWSDEELIEHAKRSYAQAQGVDFATIEAVGIERAPKSEEANIRLIVRGKRVTIGVRMTNGITIVTKLDREI